MKALLALLVVFALLLAPSTSSTSSAGPHPDPDPTSSAGPRPDPGPNSVTVLGYGSVFTTPDSARVTLYISDPSDYGNFGPELQLLELSDLELVRDVLIDKEIDAETIQTHLFSRRYSYDGGFSGEITFTYTEIDQLREMLQGILDAVKKRRGPPIATVQIVFLVDDCAALETEAMQIAAANAATRAERMAGAVGMQTGPVIKIIEQEVGGCIKLEIAQRGSIAYGLRTASVTTERQVDVSVLIEVTFALEP